MIFAVPALFGHAAIAQDNLIQNFPLRVLSGQQLASGHLPLFNPLANSGTPLLGGMNAGSFYPLTGLFIFLPPIMAWVINLIVVYFTASLGLYALCRWHNVRASAALLGALAYAYTGAMMGQMVHLAVVQGFSLLPWLVLAQLVLARRLLSSDAASWRHNLRHAFPAVLAVAALWALACLSGEPRAIAEVELVALVVLVVELVLHSGLALATWRGRVLYVVANAVALAWGAAIALAQLLPGWSFITHSERANLGYQFFGSGSLVVRWTGLLLAPDLFGGNGTLGTPSYFAGYNLAEVTGYVGIIALTATVAFAVSLMRRGAAGKNRGLVVYLVLVVVGLFATWGYFTPLGHLFYQLPLFGKTRLQSRNIVLLDLGAAVLMSWWLDAVFARRRREASLEGWRRYVTLLPAALTVALMTAMLIDPVSVEKWFGSVSNPSLARQETLAVLLHMGIAVGIIGAALVVSERWRPRRWLIGLFVADLLVFNIFCDVGLATGHASPMPSRAAALAVLGSQGRYAISNDTLSNMGIFDDLGVPNINVFTRLSAVQGYGSLIDPNYAAQTGTHPLVTLDPCQLARGVFSQLRLNTLVLSATSLTRPEPALRFTACTSAPAQRSTNWYFGALHHVSQLVMTGVAAQAIANSPLTIHLINGRGQLVGPTLHAASAPTVTVVVPSGRLIAGINVSSTSVVQASRVEIRTADLVPLRFDVTTPFEAALSNGSWRLKQTTPQYSVFRAVSLRPAQWIQQGPSGARITHVRSASWGDQWIDVRATHSVTLIRSVAWLAGWRAEARSDSGDVSTSLRVRRHGLIQSIRIPPGRWQIHFHYHAPYIELGVAVSTASSALMLLALFVLARPRIRQWRRAKVSP